MDIGDLSPRRYFATVAVVLGLLFALIAGDEDDGAGWVFRLFQWQLQSCLPMVLLLVAHMLWSRSRWFERRGPWEQLFVSGISGSMMFAPLGLLIDVYLMGEGPEALSLANLGQEFRAIFPPVTLSWMAINAPFVQGLRLRADPQAAPANETAGPDADTSDPAVPPVMQLVPAPRRGALFYLQAELHYLAVVTEHGRTLVLYNLRDAMTELEHLPGLQTHRSFWVAIDQVERFQRQGRQGVLIMRNGDQVPVSRRRVAAVNAALRAEGAF